MNGEIRTALVVEFAWWLRPWLFGVVLVAMAMQREPDWDKVTRMVCRAMKIRMG